MLALPWHCWQLAIEKKASKPSGVGQKHNSNFYCVSGWYSANILNSCDCGALSAAWLWLTFITFICLFDTWQKGICHRTWKRKTLGGSWPRGSQWQHFLLLLWGQDCAELSPKACGCQSPLGANEPYWPQPASTLYPGTLFQLRTQHPLLSCTVGLSISPLALWMDPCCSPASVSSAGWTLELADYFAVSEAVDGIHGYDCLPLPRAQTLQESTVSVRAWPVLGHPWFLARLQSRHSPAHTAPSWHCSCRDWIYALWETPSEKFSQAVVSAWSEQRVYNKSLQGHRSLWRRNAQCWK